MKSFSIPLRVKLISLITALLILISGGVVGVLSGPIIKENQSLILEFSTQDSIATASQVQAYFEATARQLTKISHDFETKTRLEPDSKFLFISVLEPNLKTGFQSRKYLASTPSATFDSEAWMTQAFPYLAQASQGTLQIIPVDLGESQKGLAMILPEKERLLVGILNAEEVSNLLGEGDHDSKLLVNSQGLLLATSEGVQTPLGSDVSYHAGVKSFLETKSCKIQSRDVATAGPPKPGLSTFLPIGTFGLALVTDVRRTTALSAVQKLPYHAGLVFITFLLLALLLGALLSQPLVRMATELKVQQEKLVSQEKLVVAGRLASDIGHEFGNILQPLVSKLDLLHEELKEAQMNREVARVEEMLECANIGAELCKGLLTLSRENADPLQRTPFLLAEATGKCLRLLTHEFKKKDIKTSVDIPEDMKILGSESQIMQVIINLVINSVHAVPTGGKIEIWGQKHDKRVHLEVIDNGEGIAPSNLMKIFEPLFSTKGPHGNGVGLSISKAIIESHDGSIRVESQVGVGTRMIIDLPALDQDVGRQ